jgi:hypothetical protein
VDTIHEIPSEGEMNTDGREPMIVSALKKTEFV